MGEDAWYVENSKGYTHDVGSKKPNAWFLSDMHCNIWEWCLDRYAEDYTSTPTDGSAYGVASDKGRVLVVAQIMHNTLKDGFVVHVLI